MSFALLQGPLDLGGKVGSAGQHTIENGAPDRECPGPRVSDSPNTLGAIDRARHHDRTLRNRHNRPSEVDRVDRQVSKGEQVQSPDAKNTRYGRLSSC